MKDRNQDPNPAKRAQFSEAADRGDRDDRTLNDRDLNDRDLDEEGAAATSGRGSSPELGDRSLTIGQRLGAIDRRWWVWCSASIGAIAIGTVAALSPVGDQLAQYLSQQFGWRSGGADQSPVLAEGATLTRVLALPPEPRWRELDAIARTSADGLERSRARYLLAMAALEHQDGRTALIWLDRLEESYSVLAGPILAGRARAWALLGQVGRSRDTWQLLLDRFPGDATAAEALVALSSSDPARLDRAISGGSALIRHPKILAVLLDRFQRQPDQLAAALQIIRLSPDSAAAATIVPQLTRGSLASRLTPEDWQDIGLHYWRRQDYRSASLAYAQALPTATTTYRVGRAAQLAGQTTEAIAAYQRLIKDYGNAPEGGQGLVRLAELVPIDQALPLLEKAIATFPSQAAWALAVQAKRLDLAKRTVEADAVRQTLLDRYGTSDEAAELRWQRATTAASQSNWSAAWAAAAEIPRQNSDSPRAAQASFWVGKWASKLGREREARQAFEQLPIYYPDSYYTWRAMAILGYAVGDFNQVRSLSPDINSSPGRDRLPIGSPTLQELYQLHEDRAAWERWQVEFTNWAEPSIPEQFVDGVLRLGVGDYLPGFFQLGNLAFRDEPTDRTDYQQLRRQRAYWRALYPLAYESIVREWSDRRRLNPFLVMGLIRQESRFERTAQSVAGAIGLMQVLPSTANWIGPRAGANLVPPPSPSPKTGLPLTLRGGVVVGPGGKPKPQPINLKDPEVNLAFGTWFLDYTHQKYQNNSLLAIASYNAGPGNVDQWLRSLQAPDPDEFLERIPFGETRTYVEAVLGNYWNYLRLYNPDIAQRLAAYAKQRREML